MRKLPWQMKYLKPRNLRGKLSNIHDMKMEMSISSLCKNFCSTEVIQTMVSYFEMVQKLDFEEEPRYNDLRMLFYDLMKSNVLKNDGIFDWINERNLRYS